MNEWRAGCGGHGPGGARLGEISPRAEAKARGWARLGEISPRAEAKAPGWARLGEISRA